jgi:hypothetical protein
MIDIKTLKDQAKALRANTKGLREGQSLIIVLGEMNPTLCSSITASKADCFYDDKKIPMLYDAVRMWNCGPEVFDSYIPSLY